MSKEVKTTDILNLPANSKQLKKKINSEIPRSIRTTVVSRPGYYLAKVVSRSG